MLEGVKNYTFFYKNYATVRVGEQEKSLSAGGI